MSGSSTGQIVLAAAGAVIGGIIGGPAGALQGASLGYAAGGIIDPPDLPGTIIPQGDVNLQTSTYGKPITKTHGVDRVTGEVFFLYKYKKTTTESIKSFEPPFLI